MSETGVAGVSTGQTASVPPESGGTLRLVFMGTPAFAVPSLRALLALSTVAGRAARVVAVVTQPDRPAGRGGQIQPGPVKALALEAGVPVLQPERLRRPEGVAALRAYEPDLIVVAAFAQILSREVLALPTYGCLNVHASLLPRWRGASPINAAILAGDSQTGITIMQMDPGLDTGPILTQHAEPIYPDDTTATLGGRLAELGGALLANTLTPWVSGSLAPQPQNEAEATVTRLLHRDDGSIVWATTTAEQVARMVRAYDPWPGSYTLAGGRILKLWRVDPLAAPPSVPPGTILDRQAATPLLADRGLRWPQLLIACSEGVVLVGRAQMEGKRPMGGDDLLRGQATLVGMQLGAP